MKNQDWLSLIHSRKQEGAVQLPEGIQPELHALNDIKAVVFDVYGTLFSSGVGDISLATEENRDQALRETLTANKIEISDEAVSTRFDDLLHDSIHKHQDERRRVGIEYPEVDIRRVWDDFLNILEDRSLIGSAPEVPVETLAIDYETRVNPTQPMPKLRETLRVLKDFGPLSIISNAQFYTPLLFETFLQSSTESLGFVSECNVWSYEMLEGKPSKALYEVAANRLKSVLGLNPENCLYVGNDMRNDIWPAQEMGFRTALFAGDRLSLRLREDHPACKSLRADVVLTSLGQLVEVIGLKK